MYLARGADIRCGKDDILANITSYGLIVNIKHVKHVCILYNPQVLLVIAQSLKVGASN